jgi:VIT1/CCC1 family predicted Fe2+/Mn2+ transporter
MKFKEKYLKDMVYGSIDGIITTFAVVSGVIGASLSYGVIIVLGLANLLADGFSMATGNYLSTKSELEKIRKKRKEYHKEVRELPDIKTEELRAIFKERGFKDEVVTQLICKITPDKEAWEKLMVSENFGEYNSIDPKRTALVTFIAFVVAGFIPLLAFVLAFSLDIFKEYAPIISIISTGLALFFVGTLKASTVDKKPLRGGIETLIMGGIAAFVAFFIGFILKNFVS